MLLGFSPLGSGPLGSDIGVVSGSGATTAFAQTASGVGVRVVSGSGATTAFAQTASGVGVRVVSGSGATTAPAQAANGSGLRLIEGSGSTSAPIQTASGTSQAIKTGTGSTTAPTQTATGIALRLIEGSGSTTAPTQTATGSGSGVGTTVGTGSTTAPTQTATGIALRLIEGSGSTTAPTQTASGTIQALSGRRIVFPVNNTFTIKQNDTSPSLGYNMSPPVNLVNASVVFNMNPADMDGPDKIERSPAVIDNASSGVVRYNFSASDTGKFGTAYAEFEVTYADGTVETFPKSGYLAIVIPKDLF